MQKVYIDRDSYASFFMWHGEMLDILPQPDHLLSEVPDQLVAEYEFACNLFAQVQDKLRPYYEDKYSNKKA